MLVSSCYIEECEHTTVYNFQVEDYHTYFVGENRVWVHNAEYKISNKRKKHILEGEGPGDPGHGPNRGFTEGAFPDTWTDEQVITAIEKVADSPSSTWKQATGPGNQTAPITLGGPDANAPLTTQTGTPVRFIVQGQDHGLNIRVIVEPNGEGIITGFNIGK